MKIQPTKQNFQRRKIHAYAASFGDDFASDLISGYTSAGDTVLDCFAGCGTSLLQAQLLNREAIGIDVDPVAALICRVILNSYSTDELDDLRKSVEERLAAVELELGNFAFTADSWGPGSQFQVNGLSGDVPNCPEIEFWFSPVQRALLAVLVNIAKSIDDPKLSDVMNLAISTSIIRKWPNTLTQARDIDHSRPHRVLRDDLSVISQINVFRKIFNHTLQTLLAIKSHRVAPELPYKVFKGDAAVVLNGFEPNSVDYVLTSPPYFNAIDYPRAHKFTQWWLWPNNHLSREQYIGIRPVGRKASMDEQCSALIPDYMEELSSLKNISRSLFLAFCRYIVDLDNVIAELANVLKPNKEITIVLANNVIRGRHIPVVDITEHVLQKRGFLDVTAVPRQIRVASRRYPFGITGFQGLMESEYVIQARKPI